MPPRYWVYIGTNVQGPLEVPALRQLPGFNLLTQVCAEGEQAWHMADEVIEIKSYFLAPPRAMPLPFDAGNTAPLIETLPEPEATPEIKKPPVTLSVVEATGEPAKAGPSSLRIPCDTCGYKNPRDVTDCMKCGTPLAVASKGGATEEMELAAPKTDLSALVKPALVSDPATDTVIPSRPPVEIPVARIATITAILTAVTATGIIGRHMWVKKHHKVVRVVTQTAVPTNPPAYQAPVAPRPYRTTRGQTSRRGVYSHSAVPAKTVRPAETQNAYAEDEDSPSPPRPVGYRVVPRSTALKQRESSPVDSTYATKRRGNGALWTQKEEEAIHLAQKQRIYGGLRTIQRNSDILMQILRDREYMAAFESGKRPYLYNQAEWSATPQEGPVYEVGLTFLGGKDTNGNANKPLKFAFDADLERGTVKPGGDDAVRSNAMHAFFDEGRIPPEERRAIAKDVEELVLAAQPGGSPLALDTVLRNFVATYDAEAAGRVADAFKLDLVQKRLRHDPKITGEIVAEKTATTPNNPALVPGMSATLPSSRQAISRDPASVSKDAGPRLTDRRGDIKISSDNIEFRMERAEGRGRTLQVRLVSHATPARLWESLTGYDRLKQFVPDMLLSEREGQDGRAIIVHTQSLTRVLFIVFKIDMHLRILEHPEQNTLEFEKIAGEFESFRGAVQIMSDPVSKQTLLQFRAVVVPRGHVMDWTLRDAASHFLVPLFQAIRSQAEAN